ncbi:uncharacterized protein PV07_03136 [Cladophialophora immunda]|uniref:Fumarylacetoacetase-like C-terminal domain-containing protein n=1 Tax=Cladophialophora immunda TaxID=569365 RepID=A0A0D2B1K0_9EURO|nr:uncharacterized protein PV07_03136 [Cladophialophora immunda]KIW31492.1 hypothetical protein PV07_03136 [Cladophialophora immunda]
MSTGCRYFSTSLLLWIFTHPIHLGNRATMSWQRLIRFEDEAGQEAFGEPIVDNADDVQTLVDQGSLVVKVFTGEGPFDLQPTSREVKAKKLLPLLYPRDVPIVKCIGLNYTAHIKEAGRTPPPYPSFFVKPRGSIASHDEDVPIPPICQNDQVDWEGELSIVIGRDGKNIRKEDALAYVAGYVVSNDVSARKWQRDPAYAGGVPQWCFSKGFDKWAPVGAVLVSPRVVGKADNLRIRTFVDGETMQDSSTADLRFDVEDIIAFVSQGTTLEKGTVIMTGTPSGVGMGRKPPVYLQDGQVVEVRIEQLGSVKNRMKFE